MLIATFGPTTGWVGKTITFEGEHFVLEGYGVITAQDVAEYDRQGHLVYPYCGMRAWVLSTAAPAEPAPSVRTAKREAQVLIFDTETSDLPRSWSRPASDVDNWPRVVQAAWIVCDLKFRPKRKYVQVVRPDGWEIAPGAQRVHGISTAAALQRGVPVADVLRAFDAEMQATNLVIAHNLEFDETIMTAEFLRAGLQSPFGNVNRFCTMRGTTRMCELLPKRNGEYKWPKLSELHQICTGKAHAGAHDAMGDAEAVLRCLRVLHKHHMVGFEVSVET